MGIEPGEPLSRLVIELAATLCRHFEGFRPAPYLCPAGVWTLGYGSTRDADGRPVAPSDAPVTRAAAEQLLQLDLARFYVQLIAISPRLAAAPAGVQAALLDFVYNLGAGRYRASTLRRKAEAFDWAGVAEELMKWVRGGGRVLRGLELRRKAEVELLWA